MSFVEAYIETFNKKLIHRKEIMKYGRNTIY